MRPKPMTSGVLTTADMGKIRASEFADAVRRFNDGVAEVCAKYPDITAAIRAKKCRCKGRAPLQFGGGSL